MPQPGFFRHLRALQGVICECQQILCAVRLEVRYEGTELITEHALRQPQFACLVVSVIGFKVSFKVDEVASQIEPGERVRWVSNGGGLSGGQRVLTVKVRVPV